MPFEYCYPRPALTIDCAVFSPTASSDAGLEVLLVRRGGGPFRGEWATPGGFVEIDEAVDRAAARELAEEVGLREVGLERFDVFDAPDRDPRGRVVSIGHVGLVDGSGRDVAASSDAADCNWFAIDEMPELAFDHADLLKGAVEYLRRRARTGPVGRDILDSPFEFRRLVELYETILRDSVDSEALFDRLLRSGSLRPTDETEEPAIDDGPFAFVRDTYDRRRRTPLSPWLA